MATHNHVLVAELLGNILGSRTGDLNPGLGEECSGAEDEGEVEDGVEGVAEDLSEGVGRREVVSKTANGDHVVLVGTLHLLPDTEQGNEEVLGEALEDELGDDEVVGDEGRLENDWHVGGVEELDGVGALVGG